jgi:hypothetical protein
VRVREIRDITRKDMPIYYRRFYKGSAVIELMPGRNTIVPVEFAIETKPTGTTETTIELKGNVDWPLVPLLHSLKEAVAEMDSSGQLPL